MNTFEMELLDPCDEVATSEALVEFVRQEHRMPDYDELVNALTAPLAGEPR
jgi:hypothetical protein